MTTETHSPMIVGRVANVLPDADYAFDVACDNIWQIDDADVAAMPGTMLALAHDDDGWWVSDDEYMPMVVDYAPANVPA
jgi:hypothetical protein